MICTSRFQTFIFAIAIALGSCSGPPWEAPVPGSVMAEKKSPDNRFLARVIAAETNGSYTFNVRDVQTDNILAERTIKAPVGYHAHIVALVWRADGTIVTATIDHDFGDGNNVFDLDVRRSDI